MSQEALAAKAGLPRPNLSDIERGKREVSLRTLRALAFALGIKPGVLADGLGPDQGEPQGLSREKLERIAGAVAGNKRLQDPREQDLVEKMSLILRPHLGAKGLAGGPSSRKGSKAQRTWLALAGAYPGGEIESLRKRIVEKARQGNPT